MKKCVSQSASQTKADFFFFLVVLGLFNAEKKDGRYRTFEGRPELFVAELVSQSDTCRR